MMKLTPDRSKAVPASKVNFEGEAHVQTLQAAGASYEIEVLAVWFKDGARNRPHVHPVDQLLVGVEGTCVVAMQHEQIQIGPGESATIAHGEWHWHGAVRHTDACHLSIKRAGETKWDQPLYNFQDA